VRLCDHLLEYRFMGEFCFYFAFDGSGIGELTVHHTAFGDVQTGVGQFNASRRQQGAKFGNPARLWVANAGIDVTADFPADGERRSPEVYVPFDIAIQHQFIASGDNAAPNRVLAYGTEGESEEVTIFQVRPGMNSQDGSREMEIAADSAKNVKLPPSQIHAAFNFALNRCRRCCAD